MTLQLPLTRRSFLGLGTLLTGVAFFQGRPLGPTFEETPAITPAIGELLGEKVFVAESGEYKRDNRFVIGMLRVQNPEVHEAAFQSFRTTLHYRTKLTWRSTDRYKKALTDLMTDYFVNQTDMRFEALIYDWDGLGASVSFGKKSKEKIPFYTQLANDLTAAPSLVVVKSQSPYGPGTFFKAQFQQDTTYALNAVNTQSSNLLQFAGVLTGAVQAGLLNNTQNKIKKSIIGTLQQKLGITGFTLTTQVPNKFAIKKL